MTRMTRLITCVTSVFCLAIALPAAAQYNVFAGGLVIRSSDNTIVRTNCPIGEFPAVSPDGTMISTTQNEVMYVVRTNDCSSTPNPNLSAFGPSVFSTDSRRLYVTDDDGGLLLDEVDAITSKRLRQLSGLPAGTIVAGMAMPPDGYGFVFMASATTQTMYATDSSFSYIYDLSIDDITWPGTGTVLLKWSPYGSSGSRRLYLAGHKGVGIYDADAVFNDGISAHLATVPVSNLTSMALSPDGSRLYAVTSDSTFLVIDTTTNAVVTSFRLDTASDSFGLGVTPDGARAYVAGAGKVHVIDTATNTRLTTLGGATSSVVAITRTGFASFTAGAVYSSESNTLSSFTGTFALGADNNGLDPAHDEVTIGLGGRTVWLPAGSFTPSGDGSFHFRGGVNNGAGTGFPGVADIEIHSLGGSTYGLSFSFDSSQPPISLDAAVLPMTISLVARDHGGITRLDLTGGLTQTIAGLQTDLNASQANTSALKSQNDVLVQANATLTQQVDALSAQIQPLTDQISSLTAINQSLTSENTRLTARIASLQERLAAEHERIEALRARLAAADERIETLKSKLDAERQVVAELRDRIKDLQQQLKAMAGKKK